MSICRKEIPYGNSTLVLETGKIAKQAYSIMASNGESQFLVTAARSGKPIDRDFLPLSVEYQEKQYAAG